MKFQVLKYFSIAVLFFGWNAFSKQEVATSTRQRDPQQKTVGNSDVRATEIVVGALEGSSRSPRFQPFCLDENAQQQSVGVELHGFKCSLNKDVGGKFGSTRWSKVDEKIQCRSNGKVYDPGTRWGGLKCQIDGTWK